MTDVDPMAIVKKLCALPHRGAATPMEKKAADILESILTSMGATVDRQPFRTPVTYIWEVWWIVGGISLGLLLAPLAPWISVFITAFFAVSAALYFDWRASFISYFPPKADSENLITRYGQPDRETGRDGKIILMAHYDSAPVSLLYLPSQVKGMQRSVKIGVLLMACAVAVALLQALHMGQPWTSWMRYALAAYFLGMGGVTSFDYFRYGYTNGASDNATGTAAAIAVANRLWNDPIPGWQVELVLTGAEEAGMVGAKQYFRRHKKTLHPETTVVLNFDSLGRGDVKVIKTTGSLTPVVYDNALFDAAVKTIDENPEFGTIKPASWHTGDFDTIWFAREGILSLTLSAQDEHGCIPHLHRRQDTMDTVDEKQVQFSVDFAEAVVRTMVRTRTENREKG
jgi:hypothetical protein